MGLMALSKEQARKEIERLVEKYNKLAETGDSKKLTEEETKKDFILPLFHALNWDTQNSKEVSAEETISKKRVDYGFRIDGIPKFFLEAKPFKEKLQFEYAEQAINYSWLKSTTWAVLTNFDELKVFNAEWKSRSIVDKLFFELKWSEFEEKFDKLWLLSRDSFLQNELDRAAEEWGKKQKKTPVTPVMKQLFNDLMVWRQRLTKSINENKDNMKILKTEEALDESVQRILDRLIFIRVCEDREIEPVTLLSKLREWKGIDRKGKLFIHLLNDVFREFDKNYNSKLFSKHPCEKLIIDDIILNDIIHGLYENSDKTFKYDFSAIDVDVLGSIYEEYLGFVLKKGKATENGMHRKKMGIYYTPTFVVDYIVRNSLGEMIKQIKPKEIEEIKVLDMACGSGSFLLKAFDLLSSYHKSKNELDFLRKIKILTDNIYGIDLDPKAIEIAQLNLLLKTLEKKRLLPKLQDNLKVGNSLIDDSSIAGDKAFEWNKEFKEIMKDGGFDVIIGNPPYISNVKLPESDKKFFSGKYYSAYEIYDIYVLFIEKGIKLLKDGGFLGFIVSNKFLVSNYGHKLRKLLLENTKIVRLVDISNIPIFKDASTYPVIIILQKSKNNKGNLTEIITNIKSGEDFSKKKYLKKMVKQEEFKNNQNLAFEIQTNVMDKELIKKIQKDTISLGEISDIRKGIETGSDKKFIISNGNISSLNSTDKKFIVKLIHSRDIGRYFIDWSGNYLIYDVDRLKGPRTRDIFEQEKLVTCRTVKRLTFGYDGGNRYLTDTSQILLLKNKKFDLKFILSILNSKLINYFYSKKFEASHMRGGYFRCFKQYLDQIPIKRVSEEMQLPLVRFVDNILELNKELQKINPNSDKGKKLQEEINRIDKQIDRKVYELYNLTEEEIKIVENS